MPCILKGFPISNGMKLLIFTQKVDKQDPILGFFHGWIVEFAKKAESVSVICLEKLVLRSQAPSSVAFSEGWSEAGGEFDLPKNVTVYSLGKERGVSWFGYVRNFYHYLFLIRGSYDRVFVHMNQEYVLLGGLYWRLAGIPVYMWRNHPAGSFLTRIAVFLSTKVFCTSIQSFTARFKKTHIMPVGNDSNLFRPVPDIVRKKYSVCMIGRVSPIKHIELALQAVKILVSSGVQISFDIIGAPAEKDMRYHDSLKKYVVQNDLSNYISFLGDVPFAKHPEMYSSYEICLNLTQSGSFDKSIVGAASCGAIPLVTNASLRGLLPEICLTEASPGAIGASIQRLFEPHTQVAIQRDLEAFAWSQSLDALMDKLITTIT